MKKLNFEQMENLQGALSCADKEGFVYGALVSGLLLAPVTMGGSFLMSAGAFAFSQIRCTNQ